MKSRTIGHAAAAGKLGAANSPWRFAKAREIERQLKRGGAARRRAMARAGAGADAGADTDAAMSVEDFQQYDDETLSPAGDQLPTPATRARPRVGEQQAAYEHAMACRARAEALEAGEKRSSLSQLATRNKQHATPYVTRSRLSHAPAMPINPNGPSAPRPAEPAWAGDIASIVVPPDAQSVDPIVRNAARRLAIVQRITTAKDLLLAGVEIVDVARRLGFRRGNLDSAFKHETGLTPRRWLQRERDRMRIAARTTAEQPTEEAAA